jgi:bifunctional UDP-N-acetylglucosamine pyrophosphorylase/glucosamine-1-phosphate N-acetyltransferase
MQNLNIVILAAGQGKRMYSSLPKVLHKVGDKPLLQHVVATASKLDPSKLIIVYGHGGEQVQATINEAFAGNNFIWAYQEQQLGTGHALICALPHLDPEAATLVLYGDVPLITETSLTKLLAKYANNLVMLTAEIDNPTGYGRVLRNENFEIIGIVEEKDASQSEKFICEINTGFYILPNQYLTSWLTKLSNENSQNEYYLTDVVAMAYSEGVEIEYVASRLNYEITGVNNKLQLEQLERVFQLQQANELLAAGATLVDKSRIEIRGEVTIGMDCSIDINCIFEGKVVLGNEVKIGAGCILKNVTVSNSVEIKPYSIIENSSIGPNSQVGPFARLRPGTKLAENVHIGNFVEVKNSVIGSDSKANHLTYIGDAEIGAKVNVGAGSVTCNYDGKHKHKTVIEDNVFVGSGTMMVAPVVLHQGSVIGAGSTITKDTPENELSVARSKQVTVKGWRARNRHK